MLILIAATSLLAACATAPTHVALSPAMPKVTQQTSMSSLALQTLDNRRTPFALRFNSDSSKMKTYNPSESPSIQLDQVFRQGFAQAGYQIDPGATNNVELQLTELLTDVTENTFGYEANTKIVIDVIAKNSSQTLNKQYSAKGLLKGPLSPDFATLELDINKLLGEISGSIINDPELNQFLQH